MYAMQYQIALPTDYDMGIIRNRVRRTGHLFDGFAGLEFKAYLIQEKSQGAPRNAYAPFYVWRDIDGMRNFCWGEPGFSAIVRDFGRQPIQDWTLHKIVHGPAAYAQARSLTAKSASLPSAGSPSDCLDSITQRFLEHVEDTTVALVTAVDITSWTLIQVELTTEEPDQTLTHVAAYEVLHVSAA
ncbi:DUF4865 family protein [Mycolicibacterium sp. 141076]|uniref:DUF4865 family protein n=1 Tax=Mycolicibacterium sp. 141076 TaxID=3090599 RepID=UPI00299E22D7|nr:DUF4865 family protein [Mycolicibacterium sp. 141076]MDX1878748.1 DUF4865 family protein [Mycolicibacterium sp. 141076]